MLLPIFRISDKDSCMKEENITNSSRIFVTRPSLPPYEEYIEMIRPLWESYLLTNMGKYHRELEEKLKEYLQVSELSLLVNGHMALELVIQAFDFPEGGEVITTPFTFVSTTHAIVRNRLKPVFCDVKPEDGTIDENKIEAMITEDTVAILPVHVYGHVCNVSQIQRIANQNNLKVIYDAAHAFGVRYKGKGIGSYGDASIFSFHATKVFNTIEGGAAAFSDRKLYDRLYNLKNFGIRGEEFVADVGTNAKMNEFAAAMGLCNLKYVTIAIRRRKERYDLYREKLEGIKGILFLDGNTDASNNYGYFPILVEKEYGEDRDELYNRLRENNIYARKYFYPLTSDQTCFHEKYKFTQIVNARSLANKVLTLPLFEGLEKKQIEKVCRIIKRA